LEKIINKALQYANDDSYILSLMVSKRANELSEGAEPLVKVDKNKVKLTDIALMEIADGAIQLDRIIEE
jgi:DNA-directed RNA polymerase subunit omega